MLTKPRRLPKHWPKGDYSARCDTCGAQYYRSQLIRKENGLLACRATCAKGRDEVELSRLNAEASESVSRRTVYQNDGGGTDTNNLPTIQRTTAADILRYDS